MKKVLVSALVAGIMLMCSCGTSVKTNSDVKKDSTSVVNDTAKKVDTTKVVKLDSCRSKTKKCCEMKTK